MKGSTEGTWRMSEDRKRKKKHFRERSYQESLQRENYLGGQRYDKEYWARLERNWRQRKGGRKKGQRIMETIKEKEEKIEQENSGIREWTEEEDDKIGNIVDPYYEL